MELHIRKGDLLEEKCDILVISTMAGKQMISGIVKEIDDRLNGLVSQLIKEEAFEAEPQQAVWIRPDGLMPQKRILLVGLGKKEDLNLERIRQISAAVLNVVKSTTAKTVVSMLHGSPSTDLEPRERSQALTEGTLLANYTFGRYKKSKKTFLQSMDVVVRDGREYLAAQKGMEDGRIFAEATLATRELVNTPGLHMRPRDLVDAARSIAKRSPHIRIKVFDQEKLKTMGAGGILGVAQGSDHPPYLVHLTYRGSKKPKKSIALIGKGVTFDSGGLSLKPADAMMTMKCDMAGAATVLGVFHALSELHLRVEVHGIFAAVENMPSGSAIRPGDILQMMNKKTVEVLNTDAEGRLILADALTYAAKQKPHVMIDLATLTGACVVALGEEITGVMSNNAHLSNQLLTAASKVGEKMWELPLEKNYRKLILGESGDLKNIGGKWGGALTAGLFLQEFVEAKTPWAHLDIAGPAFAERDYNAYEKKGATGHGVRTLLKYLQSF